MRGESSSAESKACSGLDHGYKCQNCARVFNSSRARGGHQIAHRKKRPIRRKRGPAPISPVLAAVLSHHISSDDDDDELSKAAMAVHQVGINLQAKESMTKEENEDVKLTSRAKNGSSLRFQAYKKPLPVCEKLTQQQQQQLQTKDLLGLWNPKAGSSPEGLCDNITLDLFSRDPKDESDDLDLELQLRSKNTQNVSLKLKLGF